MCYKLPTVASGLRFTSTTSQRPPPFHAKNWTHLRKHISICPRFHAAVQVYRRTSSYATMATNGVAADTNTMDSLTGSLKKFGLSSIPSFPNAYPARNPVDIYRAHVATVLAPIAGTTPETIYPALQWTKTLAVGDLQIAVPALRQKGKKPDELAKELSEKAGPYPLTE